MTEFLRIAAGVNPLPVKVWAFHSGARELRDSAGPVAGWFECTLGRMFVLDLMRQMEGVQLGAVRIIDLAAGESTAIEAQDGFSIFAAVLESVGSGSGPGLSFVRSGETGVATGDVWACGQLPFRAVCHDASGQLLVVEMGLDT